MSKTWRLDGPRRDKGHRRGFGPRKDRGFKRGFLLSVVRSVVSLPASPVSGHRAHCTRRFPSQLPHTEPIRRRLPPLLLRRRFALLRSVSPKCSYSIICIAWLGYAALGSWGLGAARTDGFASRLGGSCLGTRF